MSRRPVEAKPEKSIQDLDNELRYYRDLFENAPIGIFQSTLETGRFINLNPAMARLLGYTTIQECISSVKNITQDIYVQPESRGVLLDNTREKGQLLNFENKFRRRDGRIINGKIHARIARNKEGSMEYLEGFFEDVTNQEKISNALKQSEEHYRSIFKNTGTGTFIVEEDMTISLVNDEFERLVGYKKVELEGKMKWTQLVAFPNDLHRMIGYHKNRRKVSDRVPKNYEFTLITKRNDKKNPPSFYPG